MGAGHSIVGRSFVPQPEDTPPLSPSNACESSPFNSQGLLNNDSEDDPEVAALLEPMLPRLRRLKTFTMENLPKPHPLLKSKTQKELVKSELRCIGIHVMNAMCARSDRVKMEMRLCKYIASHYWPFPNQPNAYLRIFETYRNSLYKECHRRQSPVLNGQASTANLQAENIEVQRNQTLNECSYSNIGTVTSSETAVEILEGDATPLRLSQGTEATLEKRHWDGRKHDTGQDTEKFGANRGKKHVWWKEPQVVETEKCQKNETAAKIDEDIGIKPFPRDPRANLQAVRCHQINAADGVNIYDAVGSELHLRHSAGSMNLCQRQDGIPETITMSLGSRFSDTEGGLNDETRVNFVSRSSSPPKRRRLNSLEDILVWDTLYNSPTEIPRTTSVMHSRDFLTQEEIEVIAKEQSQRPPQIESAHTQMSTHLLRPKNIAHKDDDDDTLVGSGDEDVEMGTVVGSPHTFPSCRPKNLALRITNPDVDGEFKFMGGGAHACSYDRMIMDGTDGHFPDLTHHEHASVQEALRMSLEQQDMTLAATDLLPINDAEMQHALFLSRQTYEREATARQQEIEKKDLQNKGRVGEEEFELERYEMENLVRETVLVREPHTQRSQNRSEISHEKAEEQNDYGKDQTTLEVFSSRPEGENGNTVMEDRNGAIKEV